MIKGPIHQEDKIILNLYASNNIVSKYNKQNVVASKDKLKNPQSYWKSF